MSPVMFPVMFPGDIHSNAGLDEQVYKINAHLRPYLHLLDINAKCRDRKLPTAIFHAGKLLMSVPWADRQNPTLQDNFHPPHAANNPSVRSRASTALGS